MICHRADLSGAIGIDRPFAFARHFDLDIARATLGDFQPALPLTPEAGIYALAGMILVAALTGLAASTLRPRRRLFR